MNYQQSYNGKMFRGQRVQTESFLLRVEHQNILKIIDVSIKVELFSEYGPVEGVFLAKELMKVKPGGENHLEAVSLSAELFIS